VAKIFAAIEEEYEYNDEHSQDVIIAHIELLLTYSNRFYKRQFLTRNAVSNAVLIKMEQLMNDYFDNKQALKTGLPTVEYLATSLHLSPHYLSDLLRSITGGSAQHHIQEKLIDRAKEYLSVTDLTVSEIAYLLGFKHPQSLNKLFKRKTKISPLEFRKNVNTSIRNVRLGTKNIR
jgi:AraC family transcriptional regulator, transcriptional activator of pobA